MLSGTVNAQAFRMVSNRPYFGKKQIHCLNQIHKDQEIRICTNNYNHIVVIIRGPYRENGQWKIDVRHTKRKSNPDETILLENHSVIRDQKGKWSYTNWLERA
jgi:hypothetical protein